jgi:hypothetical protein
MAVRGSAPSSPFTESEPSMRGKLDPVSMRTTAFLCFTAPGRHRVEPLFPDAFTTGPLLAVGEHRIFPISCGARPSSRGRVSSLGRSPSCPCTPPRRLSYAGDAGHRARLGSLSCRCRCLHRCAHAILVGPFLHLFVCRSTVAVLACRRGLDAGVLTFPRAPVRILHTRTQGRACACGHGHWHRPPQPCRRASRFLPPQRDAHYFAHPFAFLRARATERSHR